MAASALFDRIIESTTTTGTGTLTLSGAVTGYQSFAVVGNSNTTPMAIWEVDANGNPSGAWEVAAACTYTVSGTTLTRGTFLASSTGSAISFAAGTKRVAQALPAGLLNQSNWTYAAGAADAAPAMAVNTYYTCDISGYTADRTATLPATAAVGDRIAICITTGDTAFELLITATAGDTLNGVAGGTEWSRLFITDEFVIFRCIVANTTWVVEYDGRLPQIGILRVSTPGTSNTAAAITLPKDSTSCVLTADLTIGCTVSTANSNMIVRRAGRYDVRGHYLMNSAPADGKYGGIFLYNNGALEARSSVSIGAAIAASFAASKIMNCVLDATIDMRFRNEEANKGINTESHLSIHEIL